MTVTGTEIDTAIKIELRIKIVLETGTEERMEERTGIGITTSTSRPTRNTRKTARRRVVTHTKNSRTSPRTETTDTARKMTKKFGEVRNGISPIVEDDYFLKNEEFRVWLHVAKDIAFESLTTVQARELFSEKFCKAWNKGSLATMYYDGTIPTELRQQCAKTSHKWGIKMSEHEKEQVSDLAYRVDSSTRKNFSTAWNHMAKETHTEGPHKSMKPFASHVSSHEAHPGEKRSSNHGDEQASREDTLAADKSERKRQRYYER